MTWIIFKYLLTAAVVVAASELAKKSDLWGALIVSLPMVSLLTLIWLYVENQPTEKLGNHAVYTFWYVLPTLPMFLTFPWALPKFGFVWAFLGSIAATVGLFLIYASVLRQFGIELLP
jgi:hypothetical protein